MKQKTVVTVIFFCLISALLTACGGEKKDASKENEVVIAMYRDGELNKLDTASYNGPHILYKLLYEGLVEDGGKDGIQPQLATDWKIDDDGKTYTFKLKEGVKFSDGTDLDADAVIFNLKRWINDERHSPLTSVHVDSMEAVDDHTVKIVFKDKAYPILTELSYPRPVRFLSPSSIKDGKFTAPVGTGPWMVDDYKKDQEFTLVPNPYYRGKKPNIDKLVFKVISEDQARVMALQSGEVDMIGGDLIGRIPLESVETLEDDPNVTVHHTDTMSSYFIGFNQDNPFFQDKKVRLALNYAINKDSMVSNLLNGIGEPAKGLFQPSVPYVTKENNQGYDYDPEKAKALLKEAGFSDTDGDGIIEKDGKPFDIDLVLSTDEFPEWKTMAEFVQSELKEVGINVHLNTVDLNTYNDIGFGSRKFDLLLQRTASDSWVPHSELRQLFAKMSGNNKAKVWYDKELEGYIDETLLSMDEQKRQKNYDKVFNFFHDEVVAIPLYYPETIYAVNNRIEGFEPGVNAYAPIEWDKLKISDDK